MVFFLFPNKNSLSPPGREARQAASARRRVLLPEPEAYTEGLESSFQELSIQMGT
jgi:hypothetical protein